jgi:hypothetical protein
MLIEGMNDIKTETGFIESLKAAIGKRFDDPIISSFMLTFAIFNFEIWIYLFSELPVMGKVIIIHQQLQKISSYLLPMGITALLFSFPKFASKLYDWAESSKTVLENSKIKASRELIPYDEERKSLTTKVDFLAQQLLEARQTISDKDKELGLISEEVKRASFRVEELNKSVSKTVDAISEKDKQIGKLQNELDQAKTENGLLRSELDEFKSSDLKYSRSLADDLSSNLNSITNVLKHSGFLADFVQLYSNKNVKRAYRKDISSGLVRILENYGLIVSGYSDDALINFTPLAQQLYGHIQFNVIPVMEKALDINS